jgi:L-alanine-DL-glutamate epimerase-like enolase superfamily enzyme
MRITHAETFIIEAETPRPVADSFNEAVRLGLPGVRIHTDAGLVGTGYTTTLGSGQRAIAEVIERHYLPRLLGRDALCHQRIWEDLYWSDAHWVGRQGITQMALAAVDIALWDLKAKALDAPLWRLVGGHKDDGRIHSYNTDGGWLNFPTDQLVRDMAACVEQGFAGVKMKVGLPDPNDDYDRLAAVRSAIGDRVPLAVDVNQKWDTTTALTWAPRFEEFGLMWMEEPLDPDDVTGHRRLADSTSIPLALGEHLYSRTAFRDFIVSGAVGYVQPDVTRLGGITEWLAVAEMAQAHHIPVIPHAGDLMRVHQHLGVGHPSVPMIECILWVQHLWEEPADVQDGWFQVPETPGASTTFTEEAMSTYRVA